MFAVNSNIIAFSATDPLGFDPPSKRKHSEDEYRDNGVGVSSRFAGTAKFSRIRIDAKLTSWSRNGLWRRKKTVMKLVHEFVKFIKKNRTVNDVVQFNARDC